MNVLTNKLVTQKILKTPKIISAFSAVERIYFLPPGIQNAADLDRPLEIGYGQTNSQPYTVAFMLELLQPKSGQRILDIGSGSGWTTALLAHIVGKNGTVWGVERLARLATFGQKNLKKFDFPWAKIIKADGSIGLKKEAPFDRILVSAAAVSTPRELLKQLKPGGRMVIPTQAGDIRLFTKNSKGALREVVYEGFEFVPLITEPKTVKR